jgi:hypothetical protein
MSTTLRYQLERVSALKEVLEFARRNAQLPSGHPTAGQARLYIIHVSLEPVESRRPTFCPGVPTSTGTI